MGDKIVVMKDGVVNQIDSPLNLYNFPTNKFVAGFIGSPSMNFISGTVSKDDHITFKSSGGGLIIKLAPELNARLDKYINKSLWLGIRPEDIYDRASTSARPSFSNHEFTLEVVEPMGNEIFLYFQVDGNQFTARIPAREKPEPGTIRTLYFDSDKLHFFDTETESAI
jgi:multiple sugar transport system ATP-binding protein